MSAEVPVVRSVVAIGAGFFTTQVLSLAGVLLGARLLPDMFDSKGAPLNSSAFALLLAIGGIVGCAGGYISAAVAGQRLMKHAIITGVIILLVNIAVAAFAWDAAPVWYQLGTVVLCLPAALLGGVLRTWQAR